jgi:hypothetical protein
MKTKLPLAKYPVPVRMTLAMRDLLKKRSKDIKGCRYKDGSIGLFIITAIKEKLSRDIPSDVYWKSIC